MAAIEGLSDKLAAVEGLHSDLDALANSQIVVIDRLLADLDGHLEALRKLLDRTPKSTASRNDLNSGKFKYGDEEYELNDDFKIGALELSDMLGLNEFEACTLLFEAQAAAAALNRTSVATAVIRFHSYRTFLADSVRLLLRIILDDDIDEDVRAQLRRRAETIVAVKGEKTPGQSWTQKCITSMLEIEQWLNRIAEQIQKMIAVGQVSNADQDEVMGIQQQNLAMQHESLGAIITSLIKLNYTSIDELKKLLGQMRQLDKWNILVVHYVPVLISFFAVHGANNGGVLHSDSRSIHRILVEGLDGSSWPLRQFHGAILVWWLAEYNSWYFDAPENFIAIEDEDREKEAAIRDDTLTKALANGAFQCILSICSQMKSGDWYDSSRIGLISTLLNDTYLLPQESTTMSPWFVSMVFEHIEYFTFSFIQHMPDKLREFKANEEDQRRNYLNTLSLNLQNDIQEPDRHLERFFVIMSFACEDRPEAASAFWEDSDSHLHGFLQWFSRRISTPLVGAFCELFRAISAGEEYANAAHHFLSDASAAATSRARKASSLSWEQIFEELEFYATKFRDGSIPAITAPSYGAGKPRSVDVDEPETPVMLESYLRLMAHLSGQSQTIRTWMISQTRCKVIDTVFSLCNGSMPPRIRACAYELFAGLSNARTTEVTSVIWNSLDQWISFGYPSTRPSRAANSSAPASDVTFETISADFEEMSSFIDLLNSLSIPPASSELCDVLSFPESLGSACRMPGIDIYVDFVLGTVLAQKAFTFDHLKTRILCSKIFKFVRYVFDSFNEKLLLLSQKTGQSLDGAIEASSLVAYVQLHPFSRVMEWMFNEKVVAGLFSMAHQDISEISSTLATAPLNQALLGAIEVLDHIMRLQTTYLDVVRPLTKTQSAVRRQPVSNPSLASFEDAVSVHLRIITDLAYYAGTCHEDLALPALHLLQQFSKSRKLNSTSVSKISSHVLSNRLIGILQGNNDTDPISKALGDLLDWDIRELECGSSSPRYRIKFAILDFVKETLEANSEAPNIAHALLGFKISGPTLYVDDQDSAFSQQSSLFHKIANFGLYYPCAVDGSLDFALMDLKTKALKIIHILWSARLTSTLVLPALTNFPFLDILWIRTPLVGPDSLWEGLTYNDPSFLYGDGSRTLQCFLRQRHFLFSHIASQLRLYSLEDSHIARTQLLSTTFGSSPLSQDGDSSPNIIDVLDFLELDLSNQEPSVSAPMLGDFEILESCTTINNDGSNRYDLDLMEHFLTLSLNHVKTSQGITDPAAIERLSTERADLLGYFNGKNNQIGVFEARISALQAWADLVVIIIQQGGLPESDKASLAIQALQIVSPKLELFAGVDRPETYIFAGLVQILVSELDMLSTAIAAGRATDMAHERLFELFKICLRAISGPETTDSLRESFYNVCYRYLTTIAIQADSHRNSTMQAIRATGEQVIETISEAAYGAAGTSSVGALILLDALARLAVEDKSSYVIESLTRNNFVTVLVESLEGILPELDRASKAEIPLLLINYKSKLSLLLTLASTRSGANKIISAGLFTSIRASGLFSTDPELGLDLDNPSALKQFYELVLAALRIIAASVLSRGPQNKQTAELARAFLAENRALMIGVLKRESKAVRYATDDANGRVNVDEKQNLERVLEELVEAYCVVIAATGYLEYEDETAAKKTGARGRFL